MILSNEPGYYAEGGSASASRTSSSCASVEVAGADRPMLGFETISFAPIDLRLVDKKLMSRDEIAWLDAYHAATRAKLSPLVDPATRKWLREATRQVA